MTRPILVFAAILVVGGLLYSTLVPLVAGPTTYWSGVALVALAAVVFLRRRGQRAQDSASYLRQGEFLCDRCRYDSPRDCSRPERPNARRCPDFRPR